LKVRFSSSPTGSDLQFLPTNPHRSRLVLALVGLDGVQVQAVGPPRRWPQAVSRASPGASARFAWWAAASGPGHRQEVAAPRVRRCVSRTGPGAGRGSPWCMSP